MSDGRAPLALSPSQLQQVAQQLLACEATWHAGHSLAQTVFTCLYLHDPPDRVRKHVVLGALVTGTRACVRIVQVFGCEIFSYMRIFGWMNFEYDCFTFTNWKIWFRLD